MKQIRTQGGHVLLGIGCQSAFGMISAYSNKETLTYYSLNGYLHENSVSRAGGGGVGNGQTVTMTVDLSEWTVKWQIESSNPTLASIPEWMRTEPIYFMIMMHGKDDKLQVMI